MTPLILQNEIKKELEKILEGFNVYEQSLPSRQGKDDSHFPYALVQLGNGKEDDEDATQEVIISFGAKDVSKDYSGYINVVNVIQYVRQHFLCKRIIGNVFELKLPINWVLPEGDENYPYYFGGILLQYL